MVVSAPGLRFQLTQSYGAVSLLPSSHPVVQALKRAKNVSKDLQKEFLQFLKDYEDWEAQALYLVEDKGTPIEQVIHDLLGVAIKDQGDWKKPAFTPTFEDPAFDQVIPPPPDPTKGGYTVQDYPQFGFKDWKQEHGFDTVPVEVGDIHTIIRFYQVFTPDREEKFLWCFNRSRYGIRGWGNEKPIKSISKSLLDNNNNPGWVVKTFLDENRLLTDAEHRLREAGEEIPNPLVLSSRDTHGALFLLLGHPFLYFGDSTTPIRNSFLPVHYDVHIHELSNHRILAGAFVQYDAEGNKQPIEADDFAEEGIMLFGLPKAVIYKNRYHEIYPTPIPAKMIRDSFKGILIPHDEWIDFVQKWTEWYPDITFTYADSSQTPNFVARNIKSWQFWLSKPEVKVDLFAQEEDIIKIHLHEETRHFNTNKMALTLSPNFDGVTCRLINPAMSPKAAKLMQVIRAIYPTKMTDGYYTVERHGASQVLILAEEYPYSYSYTGEHMVSPEKLDFRVTVTRNPANENQYLLKGEIGRWIEKKKKREFAQVQKKDGIMPKAVGMVPAFLLQEGRFMRVGSMLSGRLINDTMAGVIVEESEISDFYAAALPYLKQRNIEIYDPQGVLRVSALFNYKLHGKVTIWEVKGVLMGRMETVMLTGIGELAYPFTLNADEFEQTLDKKTYKIPKDFAQEQALRDELYATGWVDEGDSEYSMREDMAMVFVLEVLPNKKPDTRITYYGGTKLKRWKTKKLVPEISTSIKSGIDWFDVEVQMKVDGQLFDLRQLVKMWKNNEEAVELKTGDGIAVIDNAWIEKFAPILNRLIQTTRKKGKGKGTEELIQETMEKANLQVDKYQVGLLAELESIATHLDHDDEWEQIQQKLSNFKGIRAQRIPKEVMATLRDYQKEGVNWLCFLYEYGFGGILADDMGLGKTLQTLAFLAILKKRSKSKKPSLVIAPTSVVTNWMAEVRKFVPHFNAVLLHGQKRKALFDDAEKADLVITTYGLLQRDLDWLTSQEFHVTILDEAQNIKNARSKTSQAVMLLKSERRLTLTGTPIENSVMELWSQFNFLMPGFFGPLKEFERDFVKPKKDGGKKKRTDHGLLRRQTKPFILRRLKQNVAKELPPKTQQTLYCEMGEQQKKLYHSVMEVVRQQVKERINAGGVKGAKIAIFDALLKLRQICCDPRLSPLAGPNPPISAKYRLFMETLTEIVGEGHRVLVFSQFVKMLNLMHEDLEREGIPFLQLDGTTKNREELVNRFQQSDEYPVFLISLKAGGTGINLTAADYVIHYDPWWNPAAEAQATDRAYRIGQKNHLFVYKLITRNSIEEKILDLQEKKQALADNIVGNSDSLEEMLNIDDLNDLFAL